MANRRLKMLKALEDDNPLGQDDLKRQITGGFEVSENTSSIPISKIKISSGVNPRNRDFIHTQEYQELKQSIKDDGLLQPIAIDPKYNLIAGERRYTACLELGFTSIDVHFVKPKKGRKPKELAIIENIQRKDLTPIEFGQAVYELVKAHGWKQTDIARKFNKSKAWISRSLKAYDNAVKDGRPFESLNFYEIERPGTNSSSQVKFSYRWSLSERIKTKLTQSELKSLKSKVSSLEKLKEEIEQIVEKAKER